MAVPLPGEIPSVQEAQKVCEEGQKGTPSTHLLSWQTRTQIPFHTPFERHAG